MSSILNFMLNTPPVRNRGSFVVPQIVSYNNAAIQYLGRWNDTGSGMWSGWGCGQIVFKVSGTSYLTVVSDTLDPDTTALEVCSVDIDNTSASATDYYWSTASQITNGLKSVTISLPNTSEHTIILKTNGYLAYIYAETSKATIKQFIIESGGTISTWTQGAKRIQCVGDSWMGASNDWPRLMSTTDYNLYPIATGGMTCADMNSRYNFDYSGHTNTTDTTADAVIVSYGVNDFNSGISQASFEVSMGQLVDKIRVKQATAKIFLIRCVSNTVTGDDFGKYGTNMSNVAAAKANCYYINTSSLDATMTWASDNYHLSSASKQTLADFVKAVLVSNGI